MISVMHSTSCTCPHCTALRSTSGQLQGNFWPTAGNGQYEYYRAPSVTTPTTAATPATLLDRLAALEAKVAALEKVIGK